MQYKNENDLTNETKPILLGAFDTGTHIHAFWSNTPFIFSHNPTKKNNKKLMKQ